MSSTIFYKFQSQKELSRIIFDGTGITVFELKREIIQSNKLTNSNDYNLLLFHYGNDDDTDHTNNGSLGNEDSNNNSTNSSKIGSEYLDDTEVIPRSTTVIAKRSAVDVKKGKGNAGRYIAGKPRVNRANLNTFTSMPQQQISAIPLTDSASGGAQGSEDDMIKAMFNQQDEQWNQQQAVMATAQRIDPMRMPTNGPAEKPPSGYQCYKCGIKDDHFIKDCPKNQDASWEGIRVKKTTGIPRSHLKKITASAIENSEDKSNLMVTEDGNYVVAMADSKAWEKFQKIQQQKNQDGLDDIDTKDLDADLIDPLTNKLIRDPVITPCCKKTYSKNSIEDKLLESEDFECPNCGTTDIYLDSLVTNDEVKTKLEEFLKEHNEKKRKLEADSENTDEQDIKRIHDSNGNAIGLPQRPDTNNMMAPVMPFPMPPPGMIPGMPPGFIPMMMPPPPFPIPSNINNTNNNTNNNNNSNS